MAAAPPLSCKSHAKVSLMAQPNLNHTGKGIQGNVV